MDTSGINLQPPCPQTALQNLEQGAAVLGVALTARGRVTRVSLIETSGFNDLDASAISTVLGWKFVPATKGGASVEGTTMVKLVFEPPSAPTNTASSQLPPSPPIIATAFPCPDGVECGGRKARGPGFFNSLRASTDPCPLPKDKLAGIQMNTCPQALLNALTSPAPAKHATIKHKHEGESAAEGIGNSTCAEFNEKSAEDSTMEDTYFDWAQGSMTGLDTMQLNDSGQSRNLYSKPASEQKHTIHLFCAEHPEEPYLEAVFVLFHLLPKNAPIKALHGRVFE